MANLTESQANAASFDADSEWEWGVEYYPADIARSDIEDTIADYCAQELDNHKLGIVTGPDGKTYRIAVRVTLVPNTSEGN